LINTSILIGSFKFLEILEEEKSPLLIHGEKVAEDIDIFDREKYFIDDELNIIRKKFPLLKITLEHVSTSYGVNYVKENQNIAGTITPHHMLLTKKDVFHDDSINPHHFCMPVVKNETDLIELRKAACHNNSKFFLGTDSAPHPIQEKKPDMSSKPGIFSSPCSLELYAEIFDQENAIDKLEIFCSINGPKHYSFPINDKKIKLEKKEALHTPGKINNWIFYTERISIDGKKWKSNKAIFSNDILQSKQVKIEINSLSK